MIVLPEKELILVTPPKTASTSLHALLCQAPWKGVYVIGPTDPLEHVNQHTTHIPPQYGFFSIAAVVRQPLPRLASLWGFFNEEQRFYRRPELSFATYVRLVVDRSTRLLPFYRCSQAEWLVGVRVDRWLHFENLADDLRSLGIDGTLPHEFRGNHAPWTTLAQSLPPALRNEVEAWAACDLDCCQPPQHDGPTLADELGEKS